jgi:large conductance mechanosensitive channel
MFKSWIKEFKEFAMKGNVLDMAIGIIIGAAFGKIVSSLVENVLMPPLGWAMGGVDFSDKMITLKDAVTDAAGKVTPAIDLKYGIFINAVINFLIVAFAIFMVVKGINAMKKKEAAKPEPVHAPTVEESLLTEIRDLLKTR